MHTQAVKRAHGRLGALLLALVAVDCSDRDGTDSRVIAVRADGGAPPASYRAILATEAGNFSVSCPSDQRSGPLVCTPTGLQISSASPEMELTVKAKGHAFVTQALSPELEAIELQALDAFEAKPSYRTGFGAEDAAAFEELGASEMTELGRAVSVKFYIEGFDSVPTVYFQDTRRFPRHYDFVRTGLGRAISASEFEASIRGPLRTRMVGTVIPRSPLTVPASSSHGELLDPVTLEFFPSDDLTPEQALLAHRLLEERLQFLPLGGTQHRLVYVPADASKESELAGAVSKFLRREANFAQNSDLYAGIRQQILNPGLSYGTLRRVTPEELGGGAFSRRDILLLPRLPNDLPLVGGTITEELQTPLAHVNLAARARGTPNLALVGASSDPRVQPLLDKLVRFEVLPGGFTLESATLEEAEAYWASQTHPPLVPESDTAFVGLPSFDEIGFLDWVRVGVKAANLAELHQLLGPRAAHGFAVPFSAFDAYLQQNRVTQARCGRALTECKTGARGEPACTGAAALCQAGADESDDFKAYLARLLAEPLFNSETEIREAALAGLRNLVENGDVDPVFGSALDARVAELFGSATVRLRSSTNVEDLADFNGAGLYESFSAEATGERRASSRIRRVWASVWSFSAFEERSFWNVQEDAVRMGVAVNQAFGTELANGVLITRNLANPSSPGYYVNLQAGELPVANPENGAIPEIFSLVPVDSGLSTASERWEIVRQRFSSESPNTSILSNDEIQTLAATANEVELHFAPLYGSTPAKMSLDLEFKFLSPDRTLVIKQVRPYVSRSGR